MRRWLSRPAPAITASETSRDVSPPAPARSGPVVTERGRKAEAVQVDSFTEMLALADALPSGVGKDQARRSLCELIEADASVTRRLHAKRLLDTLALLKRQYTASGSEQVDAARVGGVCERLEREVLPIWDSHA